MISLCEGGYVETLEHLIFAVKGLSHPKDRCIAYLRYIPDPNGERTRKDGLKFRRMYDLRESEEYLRRNFPKYLYFDERRGMLLQAVPHTTIQRVYQPTKGLAEMRQDPVNELEQSAVNLAETISKEAKIPLNNIGISGSLLLGLAIASSDIDLIFYDEENCRKAYEVLKELRQKSLISPYDDKRAMRVTTERWSETELNFNELVEIEKRKLLHGLFGQRGYFIRLVKGCETEEASYKPLGTFVLRARVRDSRDSIFTPCRYLVDCLEESDQDAVEEFVSHRGKFTEQACKGDLVEAQGKLEKVLAEGRNYLRLLLGDAGDYLIPVG